MQRRRSSLQASASAKVLGFSQQGSVVVRTVMYFAARTSAINRTEQRLNLQWGF